MLRKCVNFIKNRIAYCEPSYPKDCLGNPTVMKKIFMLNTITL